MARIIDLTDNEIKVLMQLAGAGVTVSIDIALHSGVSIDDGGGGGGGGNEYVIKPNTLVIEMTQSEAYKHPRPGKDYNKKGRPIMQNVYKAGFRAEVGDMLEVYFPAILADGGGRYYRVWRDKNGLIMDGHHVGDMDIDLYVNKSRTEPS